MPATVSAASGLFVPITPVGPRLIHPPAYSPGSGCFESGSSTRPSVVEHDSPALVEGHARQGHAAIAHRPEDEADRQVFEVAGGLGLQGPGRRGNQSIPHQAYAGDLGGGVADQGQR